MNNATTQPSATSVNHNAPKGQNSLSPKKNQALKVFVVILIIIIVQAILAHIINKVIDKFMEEKDEPTDCSTLKNQEILADLDKHDEVQNLDFLGSNLENTMSNFGVKDMDTRNSNNVVQLSELEIGQIFTNNAIEGNGEGVTSFLSNSDSLSKIFIADNNPKIYDKKKMRKAIKKNKSSILSDND
jgi:hypothetical protein